MEPRRILELGCGTGFLTRQLLESFRQAQIDAIDISAAMIEQARREVGFNDRVHWHVCDVRDYQAPTLYDLIASSSSLQWMQPLHDLFVHLASMLRPGGRLLCSLMVEGTLGELHRLRREIAPLKISAARAADSRVRRLPLFRMLGSVCPAPARRRCKRYTAALRVFSARSGSSGSREGRWPPHRPCSLAES